MIVPFCAEHLSLLAVRPEQASSIGVIGDLERWGEVGEQAGPAMTIVIDGRVIACAGMAILWRGCGEAWALVSSYGATHRFALHRQVGRYLDQVIRHCDLWRVQASVKVDFEQGRRWLESLEFERESLMRAFGPDRADYWRYVRLRDGRADVL